MTDKPRTTEELRAAAAHSKLFQSRTRKEHNVADYPALVSGDVVELTIRCVVDDVRDDNILLNIVHPSVGVRNICVGRHHLKKIKKAKDTAAE